MAVYSTKLQITTPRVSAKKKPRSAMKGGRGRNVRPQGAGTWGKLPGQPVTSHTERFPAHSHSQQRCDRARQVALQARLPQTHTLRGSGAGGWPRRAALRPPRNVVPGVLGGPTDVCSSVGSACSDTGPAGPQTSVQNSVVVAPSQACSPTYTSPYKGPPHY